MCEAVGHRVAALERVAFGGLELGDLAAGESRRAGGGRDRAAADWK